MMIWPSALPPPYWFYHYFNSPKFASPLSLAIEWYEKLRKLFKEMQATTDEDIGSDGEGGPSNMAPLINVQQMIGTLERKFLAEGICRLDNEEELAKLRNYEVVMVMFYASVAAFYDNTRNDYVGYEALMSVLLNAGVSEY
jgi:hypothetical protein